MREDVKLLRQTLEDKTEIAKKVGEFVENVARPEAVVQSQAKAGAR